MYNRTQKNNIHIKQISTKMNEQFSSFLQLHSLDLKYMVPWSQYENSTITKTESEKKPPDLKDRGKKSEKDIEIVLIKE